MPTDFYSRRGFIEASLLSVAATGLSAAENPAARPKDRFKLIGFIKPFQNLPFDQLADTVAEVGWTGAEVPVRKDGAIEPERVEEDLPKLAEALARRKIDFTLVAT